MTEAATDFVRSPDDEDVRALLTDVYEHELPSVLADLIDEYQQFEDARPPFMWKWVHKLAPANTLPCVHSDYAEKVPTDKTITILFVTLLDDVLEKRRDRATFHAVSTIPFEWQSADRAADADYVAFAERVWETLVERLQRGPEYDTYAELFRYDLRQAINAIEYSDLVIRRPGLATMADMRRYESHNMAMFTYADVDLMHSRFERDVESQFEREADLATLREAVWTAQQMARIGNWVSTWERELREGDYSNGVVVYALENGVVSLTDLREIDTEAADEADLDRLVERIRERGVEDEFLKRWDEHHRRLRRFDAELPTMDLGPFVEGTEEVLRYHLASTGLK
jgi:hypothetical protein